MTIKPHCQIDMPRARGFTLLEILLTIAVIALLAGLSVPIFQSFQVKNDVEVAANTLVQSLRRAQSLSRAGASDLPWGVYVQDGSITMFQGSDYLTRDDAFDERFDMPYAIGTAGIQEIVFDKLTGDPSVYGDIDLISTIHSVTISINEKGVVSY